MEKPTGLLMTGRFKGWVSYRCVELNTEQRPQPGAELTAEGQGLSLKKRLCTAFLAEKVPVSVLHCGKGQASLRQLCLSICNLTKLQVVKQKLLVVAVRDKVPGLVLTWFCYGSVRTAKASDILQLVPLARCSGPVSAVLCAHDFPGEQRAAELWSAQCAAHRSAPSSPPALPVAVICTSPSAAFTLPGFVLHSNPRLYQLNSLAEQGERCFAGSTISC